ncbi:MAG: hypothetical protein HPY83_14010 [Anaerolineae bacterium]|nr:hypothetical protein [Anaerolineae bacterium]
MTGRERILAALRFQEVDHVPWAPRWDLWYNAARLDGRLPERYRGWSMYDVARDLGMSIKGYGLRPFWEEVRGMDLHTSTRGDEVLREYRTPHGELTQVERRTPELAAAGVRGRVVKEWITGREDYDAALYLVEHTHIVPQHEEVAAELRAIGEDGVLLAFVRHAPAHLVMREFTGYEGFYYQMQDNPDRLELLIAALDEQQKQVEKVAIDSPAQVIEYDGNYDGGLTPPPIYRRYFLPAHCRLTEAAHQAGKLVATHVDGRNDGLLELILQSGFDIGEAFTPPPMTNLGIADSRRVWGNRVAIWGGLAAIAFSPQFSEEEFEHHVRRALDEGGRGLVLGTGDNVPTDGLLERVRRVPHIIAEWEAEHASGGRGATA